MSWPVLAELISGGAVLLGDTKRNISQVKRVQTHFTGVIAVSKLGQMAAPSSTSTPRRLQTEAMVTTMANNNETRSV